MALVYSRSQGKVIDTSQQGGVTSTAGATPSNQTGNLFGGNEQLYNALKMLGLGNFGSTKGGRVLQQAQYFKPTEESEADKKKREEREQALNVIKSIEDFYFGNKLHYGFNTKGIAESMKAKVNPNTPLGIYNKYVASKGVFLQKATGDVGNIAWSEQQAQLRALGSGLQDYNSAKTSFDLLREGFGLPKRDYSQISPYQSDIGSLIQQFGGQ